MTLQEIYDYLGPILADKELSDQEATLILHFEEGAYEVVKNENE